MVESAVPEHGKYSFQGVRPGKYRLIAAPADGDSDTAKLYDTAEEIEVKPGVRITKDLANEKQ